MKLRPHHLIDIVSDYGQGVVFKPHPYGHAVHTVAECVLNDLDLEVAFVLGADTICMPCRHLKADGQCDDVLSQLEEPAPKQAYNDALDGKLFAYLGMEPAARMTVRAFLEKVSRRTPGIEKICTHPGEQESERLKGLEEGLTRLGVR
jgi:hypothetical protein